MAEFMNSLPKAMTAYTNGTVYGLQTWIRVQWACLSLLAALMAILLTATIVKTRSWWRSSALALLFHGLDTGLMTDNGRRSKDRDSAISSTRIWVEVYPKLKI